MVAKNCDLVTVQPCDEPRNAGRKEEGKENFFGHALVALAGVTLESHNFQQLRPTQSAAVPASEPLLRKLFRVLSKVC